MLMGRITVRLSVCMRVDLCRAGLGCALINLIKFLNYLPLILNHDKPSPPRLNTQHETGNGTHHRNALPNVAAKMIAIIVKYNLLPTPSYANNLQKLLQHLQNATLFLKYITSVVSLM